MSQESIQPNHDNDLTHPRGNVELAEEMAYAGKDERQEAADSRATAIEKSSLKPGNPDFVDPRLSTGTLVAGYWRRAAIGADRAADKKEEQARAEYLENHPEYTRNSTQETSGMTAAEQNAVVDGVLKSGQKRLAEAKEKGSLQEKDGIKWVDLFDESEGTRYRVIEVPKLLPDSAEGDADIQVSVRPNAEHMPKYNLGELNLGDEWKSEFISSGFPFEEDTPVVETSSFYRLGVTHGSYFISKRVNIAEAVPSVENSPAGEQVDAPVHFDSPEYQELASKLSSLPEAQAALPVGS